MRYLRVLHNGDLRKEALQPSPHWTIIIHEDGSMGGEVLMRDWRRLLPKDFRIPDHRRFFDIPPALSTHQLTVSPHHEEIIVSLERRDGHRDCIFLMSQLPADCRLHSALSDLLEKIQKIVDEGPKV